MIRAPLLLAALLLAPQAMAHDWMTEAQRRRCCNDRDCLPHPYSAVEYTREGWRIVRTGQLFPEGSPDVHVNPRPELGDVFICHLPGERDARCIFIQPGGS